MSPKYLTPDQVSDLLGYAPKTLAEWRYKGTGPKYVKTSPGRSGRIRYRLSDVEAWMQDREQGGEAA